MPRSRLGAPMVLIVLAFGSTAWADDEERTYAQPPPDDSVIEPAYAEPPPGDDPARDAEPAAEGVIEPAYAEPPPAGPSDATVVVVRAPRRHPCASQAAGDPCASPAEADPCSMGWHGRASWPAPRWRGRGHISIGLSTSRVEMEDDTDGKQRSLVARATGRRGWGVELELARASIGEDKTRTVGVSLMKVFGQRHLAPYLLAGGGGGTLERADGSDSHMRFGELGGGLMLRGRRLSIGIDVRRGVRSVEAPEAMDDLALRVTRPESSTDREHYTRARLLALVTF